MTAYRQTVAAPDEPLYEITQPYRPPAVGADFGVPALRAAFTGLLAALLGFALGVSGGWMVSLRLALVAGAVAAGVAWLWQLGLLHDTLYVVERIARTDFNGDGAVGQPEPSGDAGPYIMAINPVASQHNARERKLAQYRADFAHFVLMCQRSTSMTYWEKKVGRERYQDWRDLLIRMGYAEWRSSDPKQGWRLTHQPGMIMRALLGPGGPPSLRGEGEHST